jgi:hypothetical protein
MKIRDRIIELRRVSASELKPNPKNWRTHPESQVNALRGLLADVGFAGAELARELPDGSLELIDGHARAEIAGSAEIPVLVLDVSADEADKILATFDPVGAMAETNTDALAELLQGVETENESLQGLLDELGELADGPADDQDADEEPYTRKIDAPIYEPTGPAPKLSDCVDQTKTDELIAEIKQAELPDDIQQFLITAAYRHNVFNYERIANYYAHASESVQLLFEQSALVLIDFDSAIEFGFARVSEELSAYYAEDYPDAE